MKIAITSHGENSDAQIDLRLGRADYFLILDQEHNHWDCVSNTQNVEAAHGAGIQAAQHILQSGADIVITGHVGPKAFQVLNAGQCKMYSVDTDDMTVAAALTKYLAEELSEITASSSPQR